MKMENELNQAEYTARLKQLLLLSKKFYLSSPLSSGYQVLRISLKLALQLAADMPDAIHYQNPCQTFLTFCSQHPGPGGEEVGQKAIYYPIFHLFLQS